ncbi:hypothetical protein [Undibacterium baiyunense]|nr:hypothetical protein [Undibacterium baiyunense]
MIGAVIFILIIAGLNQSPEDKEKANNRDAISLCWENQAKKSNTPEEARFIAGACEMMEENFIKKYGVKP